MRVVVTLLAAALVGLGIWWWSREPDVAQAAAPAATPGQSRAAAGIRENAAAKSLPAGSVADETDPEPPADAPAPDYLAQMRNSKDYWALAESLLAAAKQGDAAAQYVLGSMLVYCEGLYDWYFIVHLPDGQVRHRTLDEAQQLTASRKVFTPDDVRDIQSRCRRLRSDATARFGASAAWMDSAAAAGYPAAQAVKARNQALMSMNAPSPEEKETVRDDARRIALEALRTRDPKVMAQTGDVAALLAPNAAERLKQQWMWPLAACLREADCASMKEWMRLFCNIDTQCQPFETPVDVIRRQVGNDYDEVERRARELNEKLDAGTLEAADIGG
jgi:hypothetical protein